MSQAAYQPPTEGFGLVRCTQWYDDYRLRSKCTLGKGHAVQLVSGSRPNGPRLAFPLPTRVTPESRQESKSLKSRDSSSPPPDRREGVIFVFYWLLLQASVSG